MDDATLLLWLDRGRTLAYFLVALGVVGEFLVDRMSAPIIKRRDEAQKAEIARLNKEASEARVSAGEAVERAAKLEREAAKLTRDAADLNRKAEEERLARVKLEEYNAPRRITDKQADILVAELNPLKGEKVTLMVLVGDPETSAFSQRLLALLKSAGLDVALNHGMMTITPSGLSFTFGKNRGRAANILADALIKAEIASKPVQAQINEQSPDDLTLVIGPKH